MFGILATFCFALAVIFNGAEVHTDTWFSPFGLLSTGLACLALHLTGVVHNRRQ